MPRGLSLSLSFWSLNNSPLPLPLRGRKRKQRRVAEVGDQGGWRHLEGAKKRLRKFLRRRFFLPPLVLCPGEERRE